MRELVVFDTNVFVSYLLPSKQISAVKLAVDKIFDKSAIPVFSMATMSEYEGVLSRKKFGFSSEEIFTLLDFVCENGQCVKPEATPIFFTDPTDKPFYDAAVAAGAWLVTGNKRHFPSEGFIVTAREYLECTGVARVGGVC